MNNTNINTATGSTRNLRQNYDSPDVGSRSVNITTPSDLENRYNYKYGGGF